MAAREKARSRECTLSFEDLCADVISTVVDLSMACRDASLSYRNIFASAECICYENRHRSIRPAACLSLHGAMITELRKRTLRGVFSR